jgi:hypothetical protein
MTLPDWLAASPWGGPWPLLLQAGLAIGGALLGRWLARRWAGRRT